MSLASADIQMTSRVRSSNAPRSQSPRVTVHTKKTKEEARALREQVGADGVPRVISREEHNRRSSPGVYPMRYNITATVFWVGEDACKRNPVHNHKSSWDVEWRDNFGGVDDPHPDNRHKGPMEYRPKNFVPRQNPFYVALPYNDVSRGQHKPEASRIIPWFQRDFEGRGKSVCKGKWVQIFYNGKHCFAQWEDCGPFTTEDWRYVFGDSLPQNTSNKSAGIDISPAVRDFLGIQGGAAQVHWRFVDFQRIPRGPWAKYGDNNPFVHPMLNPPVKARLAKAEKLKKERDRETGRLLASTAKEEDNSVARN